MEMTPRLRSALNYAQDSLAAFGHSHVSSAHLVLGLLTLHGGVADSLLRKSGLSVESVETYLSRRRSSAGEGVHQDGIPLGSSAVSAFQRAEAEARQRQHTYLGIEHLLLGILAADGGEASDLFASVHIDSERMKRILVQEIQ
jgi:ATP-dependent Clp protease ATP-binding subunit ClpC